MAHSMILGQTQSGKTTLAKQMAANFKRAGFGVLVFDPLNDPAWVCDYKSDNFEDFMKVFWKSRRCMVFIDEAGDVCNRFDDQAIKTATKGRHWGHKVFYIAQRGTLIARTIRDQCTSIFLFVTSKSDCKIHADEWNTDLFLTGHTLAQGEFYYKKRTEKPQKLNVFDKKP